MNEIKVVERPFSMPWKSEVTLGVFCVVLLVANNFDTGVEDFEVWIGALGVDVDVSLWRTFFVDKVVENDVIVKG